MTGLAFDPAAHIYTLDGEIVPSVTGVLHRAGLIDFRGIPPRVLAAARNRGTAVHAAIHYYNENDLDVDAFVEAFPDRAGYLRAWITFTEQRRFVSVLNERRLASRRHQVAGTADCFGLLDGRPILLDFATGRPQDVAKDLQTAAYHALSVEWATDEDPELAAFLARAGGIVRRYGVALKRDGSFTVEPFTAPTDFRAFLTLLDAQRIVAQRRPLYDAHPEVA